MTGTRGFLNRLAVRICVYLPEELYGRTCDGLLLEVEEVVASAEESRQKRYHDNWLIQPSKFELLPNDSLLYPPPCSCIRIDVGFPV